MQMLVRGDKDCHTPRLALNTALWALAYDSSIHWGLFFKFTNEEMKE